MGNGKEKFPHIFSKGRFGKFETKNRVKYAACCVSNYNNPDGSYTDREYARDEVIANTGCGNLTNQGAYPDKSGVGKGYTTQICINDDRYVPGLAKVPDMFHKDRAIALQQILHSGRYGGIDLGYCLQPSDTAQTLRHFRPPRVMTKDENGETRLIEGGMIVIAGPRKASQDLMARLECLCGELYVIGNAVKPRSMHNAIQEGYKLGARL